MVGVSPLPESPKRQRVASPAEHWSEEKYEEKDKPKASVNVTKQANSTQVSPDAYMEAFRLAEEA